MSTPPVAAPWLFPLPRPHTGLPLGNARMGVLAWGEGNRLKLTLGRVDFWDHRGGKSWTAEMNYPLLRKLLEAGDEPAIRAIFTDVPKGPGQPNRPSVLPIGRVDLVFPADVILEGGDIDYATGAVVVALRQGGQAGVVKLELSVESPTLRVAFSEGLAAPEIVGVPAWKFVGDYLKSISFPEPVPFQEGAIGGWRQATPEDGAVTVAWTQKPDGLRITAALGEDVAAVLGASLDKNAAWWSDFWSRVPVVDIPDERLRFFYKLGLYKFAGLTNPAGVAATLQGPWVEEYQMPPWSNDYHFNINVQMCYWPAFPTGQTHHLLPLFRLIESWLPRMRENARLFVGIEDGYALPHAVDDRCGIIGAFWTGTIDHACTAWVARMMFDYWAYTGDRDFLRRLAYPFMVGALRVYEEMMERRPDGTLSFPVSVSPEYRAAAMNAWGRDASFQLAACHTLTESVEKAAAELGETPRPIWREIREKLPKASLVTDAYRNDAWGRPPKAHIALWEGQYLECSHRHHSHLAAIHPFDIFEPGDAKWNEILTDSINRWQWMGMGLWTGWCIPWAAMIYHRAGNPDTAVALLRYWESVYTNEGYGTLHDPRAPQKNFNPAPLHPMGSEGRGPEVMQMDAGMGAVTAILDGLLHVRRGIHFVFQGAPRVWRRCGFERIRSEGGFTVSARRGPDGVVEWVSVTAERAGEFRLADPWAKAFSVRAYQFKAGETLKIVQ